MKTLLLLLLSIFPICFGGINNDNSPKNMDFERAFVVRSSISDDFIAFWRSDEFRGSTDVCDITKSQFDNMYKRYAALSSEDKNLVRAEKDDDKYTIGEVIDELIRRFYSQNLNKNEKKTLDQKTTIIVIVVVAVFGMSTISIFFVLKNNKIID